MSGEETDEARERRGRPALSAAARRALAEAEERRRKAGPEPARPPEIDGPRGPEPTRYGDWERNGVASDF